MAQMVRNCVLPLAGSPSDMLWESRHGGHTELGKLAIALDIRVTIHDVQHGVFQVTSGFEEAQLHVTVLSTGVHIEPIFE